MSQPFRLLSLVCLSLLLTIVNLPITQGATYDVPPGDTAALIAAIQAASDTPTTADVINLAPDSTYTLTEMNNTYEEITEFGLDGGGDQGLAVVHGTVTINGNHSIIERAGDSPDFRIFLVAINGNLILNNLTIRNGRATNLDRARGNQGGAIFSMGYLTINDSLLIDNYSYSGGALSSYMGNVSIHRSSFSGNTAKTGAGGISNEYSNFTLDSSTIVNNLAGLVNYDWFTHGGGISIYVSLNVRVSITNSTIANNTLLGQYGLGGGILLTNDDSSPIEISTNSTITGNYAGWRGGGLYSQGGGPIIMRNVTISNNTAGAEGGGLYNFGGSGWQFANTILADNQPLNCNPDPYFALISLGNNIDQDGSCNLSGSGDMENVDPLLEPLAYNGGRTATQALMPNSPAVNHGNSARCPLTDQRGVQRGAACDIGAFELTTNDLVPVRNLYTTNTPQLTWSRLSWATAYQVEVANNNEFRYPEFRSEILTADTLSVAPTALLNGVWYWRVHALQSDGRWGGWSPAETIRIDVPNP